MARAKLPIALGLVALAVAAGLYYGLKPSSTNGSDKESAAPRPVPVTTAFAQRQDLPIHVRSVGTVVSNHSVEIRPQIDGVLMALPVKEGQTVQQGELVAQIDDRSIRAVLVQQQAELANRQAQLDVAQLDLKRYAQLRAQNAIAGQTFDQQQTLLVQLQQALQTQKAVIQEQEVLLSYTRIKAPMTGIVGIINTHRGNYVRAGDAQSLFSIVQADPISVEVAFAQSYLPQLLALARTNELENVMVNAYNLHAQQHLATGTLYLMDNRVSAATGTVRVRARFDNAAHRLWPGQSVVAMAELGRTEGAIVVPQTAIQQGNRTTYVWRIQGDRAEQINVTVLHTEGQLAAVSALNDKDEVVTDGALRLQLGTVIERKNAALPQVQVQASDGAAIEPAIEPAAETATEPVAEERST